MTPEYSRQILQHAIDRVKRESVVAMTDDDVIRSWGLAAEAPKPELTIGRFVLRARGADEIWIGRTDGEAGTFLVSDLEETLLALENAVHVFYCKNF